MILAIFLSLSLVVVTFIFHYHVLLWLSTLTPKLKFDTQAQVLVIVIALFFTHIIEIGFYAVSYFFAVEVWDLGVLNGRTVTDLMHYFYYSGVIFTSLGLGDIFPEGHIRFMTMLETLNGFLLITWTASFTFLSMSRLWRWDDCCNDEESGDV